MSSLSRHSYRLPLLVAFLLAPLAAGCRGYAPGEVVAVNKTNFRSVVIDSKRPVVVEFWSLDCEPCRELEPHLAALAKKHEDLLVAKINSADNEEIAGTYGVRLVPTVMVFQDGEMMRRQVSPKPHELAELVAPYVAAK